MSFQENPYKSMDVRIEEVEGKKYVYPLCSSCGGGWQVKYPIDIGVEELFRIQIAHVEKSHERTEEDFAGWH